MIFWSVPLLACRIFVPWPGIEPKPSAVKAQCPNRWTTREFPQQWFFVINQKCTGHHPTPKNDRTWITNSPRVRKNVLCLAFLSFLFQTPFASPNYPPFCHPKPSPCQLPLHTPLFPFCLWSLLTCEQQHQAQGKKVWKWGQEVGHLQRESSPECLRDVVPNQAVKGGAPGPGYTGSGCSNRRRNVYKQREFEPLLCVL